LAKPPSEKSSKKMPPMPRGVAVLGKALVAPALKRGLSLRWRQRAAA
jgi:hypothetical protein